MDKNITTSFLKGVMLIFSFSFIKLGKPKQYSELEDKKALEQDFNNISNDLWRAVGEFKERYC